MRGKVNDSTEIKAILTLLPPAAAKFYFKINNQVLIEWTEKKETHEWMKIHETDRSCSSKRPGETPSRFRDRFVVIVFFFFFFFFVCVCFFLLPRQSLLICVAPYFCSKYLDSRAQCNSRSNCSFDQNIDCICNGRYQSVKCLSRVLLSQLRGFLCLYD